MNLLIKVNMNQKTKTLQSFSLGTLNNLSTEFLNEIIRGKDHTRDTQQLAQRVLNTRQS